MLEMNPHATQNTVGIGGAKSFLPAKSSPQALKRGDYSQRLSGTSETRALPGLADRFLFTQAVKRCPSKEIYETRLSA